MIPVSEPNLDFLHSPLLVLETLLMDFELGACNINSSVVCLRVDVETSRVVIVEVHGYVLDIIWEVF